MATEKGENWTGTGVESGFDGPLYCGYWHDVHTGMDLARNRYYDPGLFDVDRQGSIGYDGGNDLYGYCGDDPLSATDPSGMDPGDYTPTVQANGRPRSGGLSRLVADHAVSVGQRV